MTNYEWYDEINRIIGCDSYTCPGEESGVGLSEVDVLRGEMRSCILRAFAPAREAEYVTRGTLIEALNKIRELKAK